MQVYSWLSPFKHNFIDTRKRIASSSNILMPMYSMLVYYGLQYAISIYKYLEQEW